MVGGKLAFFPFSSIPSPEVYQYQILGFAWLPYLVSLAYSSPWMQAGVVLLLRQRLRHRHAHIIDKLCSVANTGVLHPFLLYHNAKLNMHPHGYIQASQLIDAHTPGTWFLVHDFGVIVIHP